MVSLVPSEQSRVDVPRTIFSKRPPSRVWVFSERITFYPTVREPARQHLAGPEPHQGRVTGTESPGCRRVRFACAFDACGWRLWLRRLQTHHLRTSQSLIAHSLIPKFGTLCVTSCSLTKVPPPKPSFDFMMRLSGSVKLRCDLAGALARGREHRFDGLQ
jgi:hypothetical protein